MLGYPHPFPVPGKDRYEGQPTSDVGIRCHSAERTLDPIDGQDRHSAHARQDETAQASVSQLGARAQDLSRLEAAWPPASARAAVCGSELIRRSEPLERTIGPHHPDTENARIPLAYWTLRAKSHP